MRGNVYRQLPLYCFLEEEATSVPQREDPETYEKLVGSNAKYLADMMKAENLQSGSDDMRENQETAVEKEKNRPEAHLSENEKLEEKQKNRTGTCRDEQVTGEKKSSETGGDSHIKTGSQPGIRSHCQSGSQFSSLCTACTGAESACTGY